jgi:hypothetical protein
MGTVSMDGITADLIETSAFGTIWKTFEVGMKDGGSLSFNGFLDPDDTTGQEVLRVANLNSTDVTDIRFYVDATSYYTPCATAGYFSPALTTGQDTIVSSVNITTYTINADKNGMAETSFTCKVSGSMVLI